MPDGQTALLRLMAWLSPAFPVGSFSYSHGLETAVHRGLVSDAAALRQWLVDLIERGSAWNDAVLFAEAHRLVRVLPDELKAPLATSAAALTDLCDLAEALAGSLERHRETMLQGSAFLKAASAWPHPSLASLPAACAYPAAVGAVAGAHGIDLQAALAAFLHAFASNQIQAAIRLGVIGQTDAMATLAALEPTVTATAPRAAASTLDDLGSSTMMAEIAAMQHETHYSRLFRT